MPDKTRTIVDNHKVEHEIIMWVMTETNCEYYITETGDRGHGYVMTGVGDEWGDFTKEQIEDQGLMVCASAKDGTLNEVLAPEGWHWKNVIN